MKIVVVPDSFKGSLTSVEICDVIERAALASFKTPNVIKIPIADGGEGTIQAIVSQNNGIVKQKKVCGSIIDTTVNAKYAVCGDTIVIEMAQANGLTLLSKKDPLNSNTFGTGQLILHALESGYKDIVIAIGGSATNDGGTGAMQALGFEFFDENNNTIKRMCGKNLKDVKSIINNAHTLIKEAKFTVMCDVDNVLTGKNGATYTFGCQKGADEKTLQLLENGMKNYEKVLNSYAGFDVGAIKGTGAAGGLGGALKGFLNAQLKPGILSILELAEFSKKIKNADFIVTGEGRADFQSAYGKVLWGVALQAQNIPVIAFVGGMEDGLDKLKELGITAIVSIVNKPMKLKEAIENAKDLLYESALNTFELMKINITDL